MADELPLTALIVDDEPLARQGIRDLLADDPSVTIAGEAGDGPSALAAVERYRPDLLFLDIQMPEMDGVTVARSIPKEQCPTIVFVTAFDRFAVEAFSLHALDYLLKPVDPVRFRRTMERVTSSIRTRDAAEYLGRMDAAIRQWRYSAPRDERIPVRTDGRIILVPTDSVLWIEAAADYVVLHTDRGTHTTRSTLSELADSLDQRRFLRIHRSMIVNSRYIREAEPQGHGDLLLRLSDGTELTVSRNFRKNIDPFL